MYTRDNVIQVAAALSQVNLSELADSTREAAVTTILLAAHFISLDAYEVDDLCVDAEADPGEDYTDQLAFDFDEEDIPTESSLELGRPLIGSDPYQDYLDRLDTFADE